MFRWTPRIWSIFRSWLQRFVGFEPINSIIIERSLLEDIASMAQGAHPKEILVFVSATKGVRKGVLRIDEIQLQAYDASVDSAHVWLHNLPPFTNIVGTIHSHPSSSRRPSRADLSFWSKYGVVHAIMGYPYRPTDITFYSKDGERIDVVVV